MTSNRISEPKFKLGDIVFFYDDLILVRSDLGDLDEIKKCANMLIYKGEIQDCFPIDPDKFYPNPDEEFEYEIKLISTKDPRLIPVETKSLFSPTVESESNLFSDIDDAKISFMNEIGGLIEYYTEFIQELKNLITLIQKDKLND